MKSAAANMIEEERHETIPAKLQKNNPAVAEARNSQPVQEIEK